MVMQLMGGPGRKECSGDIGEQVERGAASRDRGRETEHL